MSDDEAKQLFSESEGRGLERMGSGSRLSRVRNICQGIRQTRSHQPSRGGGHQGMIEEESVRGRALMGFQIRSVFPVNGHDAGPSRASSGARGDHEGG